MRLRTIILLIAFAALAAGGVKKVVVHYDDGRTEDFLPTTAPIPPEPPEPPPQYTPVPVTGTTSDGMVLKSGQALVFARGVVYTNDRTINAPSDSMVTSSGAGALPLINQRSVCVQVAASASKVVISDLAVSVRDKTWAAVSISGSDCKVFNIQQQGAGNILRFDNAKRLTAAGLYDVSGNALEYIAYSSASEDCWIYLFDWRLARGYHGIRAYGHKRLHLGHPTETLTAGPGKGFAGYISDTSEFNGVAVALKDGTEPLIERLKVDGTAALGPHTLDINQKPNWESLRLSNLVMRGCEFNVKRQYLELSAGLTNPRFIDCKFTGEAALFDIKGPAGPNGEWPRPNPTFERCTFVAPRLATASSSLASSTFIDCTFNGNRYP